MAQVKKEVTVDSEQVPEERAKLLCEKILDVLNAEGHTVGDAFQAIMGTLYIMVDMEYITWDQVQIAVDVYKKGNVYKDKGNE